MNKSSLIKKKAAFWSSVATAAGSTVVSGILTMAVTWSLLSGGVSAAHAGFAAACLALPVSIGMFVGGRLVDRFGARLVLLISNLLTLGVALAAMVLIATQPGALVAIVALLAVSNGLGAPGLVAQDARLPQLAKLSGLRLERANGLRDLANQIGMIGGPAIGVLAVEFAGLAGALVIAVALLAIIAILDALFFPRFREGRQSVATSSAGANPFRRILADRTLSAVVLLALPLVAIFTSLDEILAPTLALSAGWGGTALTIFLALTGLAAFTSAAAFAKAGHRISKRKLVICGVAISAMGFLVLAAVPAREAFFIAPVLIGCGVGPLWPVLLTAIQSRVPRAELGGVIGALSAVALLAQPASSLVTGPAVAAFGAEAIAGVIAVMAGGLAVLAPFLGGLRELDPLSARANTLTIVAGDRLSFIAGTLLAAGALFVGYQHLTGTNVRNADPSLIATAQAAPPVMGVGALGRIEPASRILRISAPFGAEPPRIERILVRAGDTVPAGQVLAVMADHGVRTAVVASAEAQVRIAETELARIRAGARPSELAAQRARIDALAVQVQFARTTLDRRGALMRSDAASAAQFDDAKATLARLMAELAAAEAVYETLAHARAEDIAVSEAALNRARADLAQRRAELELSQIRAPIDGTVLAVNAREGERAGADGLLSLADLRSMDVVAEIYESDALRVRIGLPAEIRLPGIDAPLPAHVSEIGWLVRRNDAIGTDPVARIDARVIEVRLRLEPEASHRVTRLSNMQVAVRIHAEEMPAASGAR
ncbi:MAG: MFS transporter [Beijerinckiaceae bacterium]|nr:MFS transporter [Beijerinckiaceae bacterium]